MKRIKLYLVLICIPFSSIYAQKDSSASFQPTHHIGLGSGIMGFYGDFGRKEIKNKNLNTFNYNAHLSYQYRIKQNIGIGVSLFKSKANMEETGVLNDSILQYNFLSDLMGADLSLTYYFNVCKQKKVTTHKYTAEGSYQVTDTSINNYGCKENAWFRPYVSLGIGFLSFTSKGDLQDSDGVAYNYWSDGTLRSMGEYEMGASEADILQRDYNYETSLNSGTSLFLPLKLGVQLKICPTVSLDLGSVIHYSFSDEIDNVANESNDWYTYSSFTLRYNLSYKKSVEDDEEEEGFEHIILTELDCKDHDDDGVITFYDHCPNTSKDAVVNEAGCPMDDDFDAIPNYRDKQNPSRSNVTVDLDGIEIMTGYEFDITKRERNEGGFILNDGRREQILLMPNIKEGDNVEITNITNGKQFKFDSFSKEQSYMLGKTRNGDKLIVKNNTRGDVYLVPIRYDNKYIKKGKTREKGKKHDVFNEEEVVTFKVQIVSSNNAIELDSPRFQGLERNVINSYTDIDGLIKYTVGEYSNSEEGLTKVTEMKNLGFTDAFVIVFINGKRVKGKKAAELIEKK